MLVLHGVYPHELGRGVAVGAEVGVGVFVGFTGVGVAVWVGIGTLVGVGVGVLVGPGVFVGGGVGVFIGVAVGVGATHLPLSVFASHDTSDPSL